MPSNGASDMTGDSSDGLVTSHPTIFSFSHSRHTTLHTPYKVLHTPVTFLPPIQSSPIPQPQWRSRWDPGRAAKETSTGRTVVNLTHHHGYLPNLPIIDTMQSKGLVLIYSVVSTA